MIGHRKTARSRQLLAYVLAIAFALRAVLPQGFMPGDAWFSIQLCPTGLGAQAIAALADHVHAGHHMHHAQMAGDHASGTAAHSDGGSQHRHLDQCPFGLASLAMALPDVAVDHLFWSGEAHAPDAPTLDPPYAARDYRPQPRGPPTLS